MKTIVENLRAKGEQIALLLNDLSKHSSIRRWNFKDDGSLVFVGGDFAWNKLDDRGRQLQAECLEQYRRFHALLQTLLREQPDDTLRELRDTDRQILGIIQQQDLLFADNIKSYFEAALSAFKTQIDLINRLYGTATGKIVLVPDTNALIFNPDLTKWTYAGIPEFIILLTPTVLSELDNLKVNHRVESVQKKAEQLIRQLKEFRRRAADRGGSLAEGATLVTGVSEIVAGAIEPQIQKSLPWLDPANKDDQILAGVIEAMRTRPHSPVLLVTRDINLQNKADFAGIPFLEPPDPSAVVG